MNQEDPRHDNNATLDRLIPEKGYVKGNVVACTHIANQLKNELLETYLNYNKEISRAIRKNEISKT